MWSVNVVSGPHSGTTLQFTTTPLTPLIRVEIGRKNSGSTSLSAKLVLKDDVQVSSKHCVVGIDMNGSPFIEDSNSTNGTFELIGGSKERITKRTLQHDSTFLIGSSKVHFLCSDFVSAPRPQKVSVEKPETVVDAIKKKKIVKSNTSSGTECTRFEDFNVTFIKSRLKGPRNDNSIHHKSSVKCSYLSETDEEDALIEQKLLRNYTRFCDVVLGNVSIDSNGHSLDKCSECLVPKEIISAWRQYIMKYPRATATNFLEGVIPTLSTIISGNSSHHHQGNSCGIAEETSSRLSHSEGCFRGDWPSKGHAEVSGANPLSEHSQIDREVFLPEALSNVKSQSLVVISEHKKGFDRDSDDGLGDMNKNEIAFQGLWSYGTSTHAPSLPCSGSVAAIDLHRAGSAVPPTFHPTPVTLSPSSLVEACSDEVPSHSKRSSPIRADSYGLQIPPGTPSEALSSLIGRLDEFSPRGHIRYVPSASQVAEADSPMPKRPSSEEFSQTIDLNYLLEIQNQIRKKRKLFQDVLFHSVSVSEAIRISGHLKDISLCAGDELASVVEAGCR